MQKSTPQSHLICEHAIKLFQKRGFEAVSMVEIAENSGITESELYTWFGNKQDIVLQLYQSINADWQFQVESLVDTKLTDRFERALTLKMDLMRPYVDFLGQIVGQLLMQGGKLGIVSPRTSHIRAMGRSTMRMIVEGASDSNSLRKKAERLPSLLYLVHWAVLFVYVQTGEGEKARETLKVMTNLLKTANTASFLGSSLPMLTQLGTLSDLLTHTPESSSDAQDREILQVIFNHRKTTEAESTNQSELWEIFHPLHITQVNAFTSQQQPLHFMLPAFPAKSPNRSKVLGKQPDLGEEIALNTLESMCEEISQIYPPGASITICSDGRIFSDLVGVTDADVTLYIEQLRTYIREKALKHIDVVNLEDLIEGSSFDEMRKSVLEAYAESLEQLTHNLKTLPELKGLFNGMHRFITEDRLALEPDKSRSQVKKEAKTIAAKVIQHSNAWTRFLAYVYPQSIRLSIHPYPAHSPKIGIQLTKARDNWITPWHGVIVLQDNEYVLTKRKEAEEIGAKLVYKDDQPYYYSLIPE